MCITPITIKNPNYRPAFISEDRSKDNLQYIQVPCGKCFQCIRMKQLYYCQRIQVHSIDHVLYMFTLTYNDDMIPYIDIGDYRHNYADVSDLQKLFKRMRRSELFPPFKYTYVTEYGGKRHRPHFHGILFFSKDDIPDRISMLNMESRLFHYIKDNWVKYYGSTFSAQSVPLFTYHVSRNGRSNYDLHLVVPDKKNGDIADVGFYVSKYVIKDDPWWENKKKALLANYPLDEANAYIKILRPRCVSSKKLGCNDDWLNYCIRQSKYTDYPYAIFINPVTGMTSPMSPYYRKKYMTVEENQRQYFRSLELLHFKTFWDSDQIFHLSRSDLVEEFYKTKEDEKKIKNIMKKYDKDFAE